VEGPANSPKRPRTPKKDKSLTNGMFSLLPRPSCLLDFLIFCSPSFPCERGVIANACLAPGVRGSRVTKPKTKSKINSSFYSSPVKQEIFDGDDDMVSGSGVEGDAEAMMNDGDESV
jgi:hypothetical protein